MNYFCPGSVNTHWGPGPVNTNLVSGPVNTNSEPGPPNTNWGPAPGAWAGGQAKSRGQGNTNTQYNLINIFLEKSYTKCGRETIPRPFSKKSKFSISLDQYSKVLYILSLLFSKLKTIESD